MWPLWVLVVLLICLAVHVVLRYRKDMLELDEWLKGVIGE